MPDVGYCLLYFPYIDFNYYYFFFHSFPDMRGVPFFIIEFSATLISSFKAWGCRDFIFLDITIHLFDGSSYCLGEIGCAVMLKKQLVGLCL